MKKILLIMVILTIGVFGQNNDKSTKLLTQQEITNRLFENTIEATRVKVVNTSSPIEKDESDFTDGTESFATATDTLSGVSDTVVFNFGNQFRTCAVVIRDTTGGSALVDSLVIETYIPMLNAWTYYIAMYKQGEIFQGNEIVPGNNKIVRYAFVDPYIGQIRILWYYGANKVNRKVPLVFEGSN